MLPPFIVYELGVFEVGTLCKVTYCGECKKQTNKLRGSEVEKYIMF